MEFVKGRDASELMPAGKPLAVANACEIIRQAAIGLQHAFEAGLVHRDIKPSNLMVTESGVVKILDLGLARIGQEAAGGELTSTGAVMGTIDYMAPEQASDTHDVDIRADIYSLGATLYRLLTGAAPFSGERFDSPVKKLLALATQPPPPVRAKRPEVTGALASLIENLLAKDPADRLPTPAEVAEALAPFCRGADLPKLIASLPPAPPPPAVRGAEPQSARKTEPSYSHPTGDTAPTIERAAAAAGAVGNVPGVPSAGVDSPSVNRRAHAASSAAFAGLGAWVNRAAMAGRKIPRPIAIAAACGGAALAVLLGIVLFWETRHGTVRIEIIGDGIEAKFDKNGLVITGADQKPIRITPTASTTVKPGEKSIASGNHTLTITRGKFSFQTSSFELQAKGETTLRIELQDGVVTVTQAEKTIGSAPLPAAPAGPPQADFALAFDGKSNYVAVPTLRFDGSHPVTIEGYFESYRNTKADVDSRPVAGWDGAIELLERDNANAGEQVPFGAAVLSSGQLVAQLGTNVRCGTRHHAALVWDGKQLITYVNGRSASPPMPVASIVKLQPQADGARSNFCLGTLLRAHDRTKPDPQLATWFEGKMDEVHISSVARYREDFEPKPRFEPDEHTMALYHFDEGQGTELRDSSGNEHHGTIVGAKWVPAMVDRLVAYPTTGFALEFDGQTTFIEFPTFQPDFSQPFTFEAVVQPHPEPRQPVAGAGIWPSVGKVFSFVNRDNANYWMVFNHVGGGWAVRYRTPQSDLMTYTRRDKLHGVRHHIAGVWTGEQFNWFVDGQLSNGFAEAKLPDPSHGVGNNGVAHMGSERSLEGKTSRQFRGTLDEVRISRRARYQMNYTPASRLEPDTDTLALYHFDEGQGDVLNDSSGNNHHGKIVGAKWVRSEAGVNEPRSDALPGPPANYALRLAGAGERLEIPDLKIPARGPWTVEGWVTPRDPLPQEGGSSSQVFRVSDAALVIKHLGGQGIKWSAGGPATKPPPSISSDEKVEVNKPVHVALTRGPEGVSFYLNGVLQGQPLQIITGKEALLHLCQPDPTWHKVPFQGELDEVRVSSLVRYREAFTPKPRFEPDADTLALYHCDEVQGDVLTDSSGNNRHGKISGATWVKADSTGDLLSAPPAPTPAPAQPGGFALHFTAAEDQLDTSNLFLNAKEPWTVEGWVTPDDPLPRDGEQALVFLVDQVWLSVHNRYPGARWTSGGPLAKPGPAINKSEKFKVGERVHLALQHGPKGVSMFVNGVRQGEPLPFVFLNERPRVRIRTPANPSRRDMGFYGTMDEVRVSDVDRYQENFTPQPRFEPDANTLALYHCDEGQGEELTDSSGHNRHGKIVGAKWAPTAKQTSDASNP
jgi:hypothetical protein